MCFWQCKIMKAYKSPTGKCHSIDRERNLNLNETGQESYPVAAFISDVKHERGGLSES
jgi:hypothetical protein